MSEEEKLECIADVLDLDVAEISSKTRLNEIAWDSMGMLSIVALAKTNGKAISGAQIRAFTTIEDILQAVF